MLKRLSVTNFAIIENVDISFKNGLSVFSGETGAGKSLLIDCLNLLLGERASPEMIRDDAEKAVIRGEFNVHSPELSALLSSLSVPFDNDTIVLERSISRTKSLVKANNVTISLGDASLIGKHLAFIHNQFDSAKLFNPDTYLPLLDSYSPSLSGPYLADYQSLLSTYKEKKADYLSSLAKQKKIQENKDFYSFQLQELKSFDLKEREEEELASEISLLKNHDEIYSLSNQAKEIVDGESLDKIYELDELLKKLSLLQKQYEGSQKVIDDSYLSLSEAFRELGNSLVESDFDPERLDSLLQRESDLEGLKKKYQRDVPGLIAYRDELASLVGEDADIGYALKEKKAALDEAYKNVKKKGEELSEVRKKIAESIEKDVISDLSELLLKAVFKIAFSTPKDENGEIVLGESGIDSIDFLISTNVGEGLKSLNKVISGGEASRLSLAFEDLYIKSNKIPTVIFDEIDTGLSGLSAEALSQKIHEMSLYSQSIAITHTPQLASLSDHHFLIAKRVEGKKTFVNVKECSLEEKIEEVAYLISDGKITPKQLEYAKEMVLRKR